MLTLNGSGLLQQAVANSATFSGDLPPSNISPPELVGKAEVGATVSARPGVWAGLPAPRVQTTLFVSGVARRSPCLLGPEDDGKEIIITDAASNDAGEAVVSSSRAFVRHPVPHALGTPEDVSIGANDETVVVDAGTFFVGASGGQWSATCAAGADALQLDIDETGLMTLGGGTMIGSSVVSLSYSNSGGSASAKFTVFVGDTETVAGPEYDGTLGEISITSEEPVEIGAGLAFSGDNLAFSATGLPEGVAIDLETGRLVGRPAGAGSYSVTVIATNTAGSASGTFLIIVLDSVPVIPPPTEDPALIGTLENRSYTVDSGDRFYNIASTTTGTQPITFYMLPKVISVEIIDNGDGTYGRLALTAGYPEPTAATEWLLDGSQIGAGKTGESIDANGLSGDLTVKITATNTHGSDALESAAVTLTSLVNPVHLGTAGSYQSPNTAHNTSTPAYSVGDLVVISFGSDGGDNIASVSSVVAANGETVTKAQEIFGPVGTGGVSNSLFWYIATSARSAGSNVTVNHSYDQSAAMVSVFDAGTFDPKTPITDLTNGEGNAASAVSPATTATEAGGMVVVAIMVDTHDITGTPAGWTERGTVDGGAVNGYIGTRDAFTTASESIAAKSFTLENPEDYAAITFVLKGKP